MLIKKYGCFYLFLLVLIGFSCVFPATASNTKREAALADQVLSGIVVGDPVWLTAKGVKFLGVYTPANIAQGKKRSTHAIILIHGRGAYPTWGFFDNMRSDLTDVGWHTLSIQMPVLDRDTPLGAYGTTFDDAFDRIDAAIAFLQKRGITSIVLLGHSTGAMMAVAKEANRPSKLVTGLIAIGLSTTPSGGPYMLPVKQLPRIRKPILDIYGAQDLPDVLNFVQARKDAAAAAPNKDYTIVRIKGANHFYTDRYELLLGRIKLWLHARRY